MAPIMDKVLTQVLISCKSNAGIKQEIAERPKEAFSLDSDSEESDGELVGMDVDVNFIDEKASSVHCVGTLMLYCPAAIMHRLDEIL